MSFEDRDEIVTNTLTKLLAFIKRIEATSYCDAKQLADAQQTLGILMSELYLLGYKMEYLKYGYSNICLDEVV